MLVPDCFSSSTAFLFLFLNQFYCAEGIGPYDAYAVHMGKGGGKSSTNQKLSSDYKSHRMLHPPCGTASKHF